MTREEPVARQFLRAVAMQPPEPLGPDLVRLECAVAADAVVQRPSATARTAQVRGTAFPLDGTQHWTVDMWSPPTDPAFVEQLARATICYRSPGCTVSVDASALARSSTSPPVAAAAARREPWARARGLR